MVRRSHDIVEEIPLGTNVVIEEEVNDVNIEHLERMKARIQEIHEQQNEHNTDTEHFEETLETQIEPQVVSEELSQPRYNLRANRAQPGRWEYINLAEKREYGLQMSTRTAIKLYGASAMDALIKEVHQLLDKNTVKPVHLSSLSQAQVNGIIRSHVFYKDKFLPTGEFEKLKARLVAGGDGQDRNLYDQSKLTSYTVSTTSVFTIAAIAASENRAVATVDFPGAYLNSDMPSDGKPVFMLMDKYTTAVLTKLEPSYQKFVKQDGTCVVQVMKGLYGLIESAKLWYDKLTHMLKGLGFVQNKYDPCVLNRYDKNGKQTTLTIHVDDVFISAPTEEHIDELLIEINSLYSGLTIKRGRYINYLGMIFDFTQTKKCKVLMTGFVEDLLSITNIEGTANTPAASNLFKVNKNSKPLDTQSKKQFHSMTAKLLYLSKRIRPDILTAVSFLTTRVQNPTEEDQSKLERVLKYIKATKTLGIVLEADKFITVIAYVDAAYGVHDDYKSHTGATITLFKGPVYAKSSKQKLMTKSSTEAELVAISDVLSQIIGIKNFLEDQGYKMPPAKLFEDNMSTISLVKSGKSNSNRTRHIAIRFFFVSDRVNQNEIEIEYLPTGSMIADILTKPLQGNLFRMLRDQLLNWI